MLLEGILGAQGIIDKYSLKRSLITTKSIFSQGFWETLRRTALGSAISLGGDTLEVLWEEAAQKTYEALLAAVPGPLKAVAQKRVLTRIQGLMPGSGLDRVGVQQVVEAFRRETPGMYRSQITAKVKELGLEGYWPSHE